ncbi:thioredoxin family protein [Hirschia litorea]|uniref:Thioredoxin family protein n=1 Tax=Hirschia litorea TaxID=1199156 RepID=A0ABW2IK61_9PROT
MTQNLENIIISMPNAPFNETEDGAAKLETARQNSLSRNVPLLILFGANWCPDARLMSATLSHTDIHALLGLNFEIVQIDVGRYDRNQSLHAALGFDVLEGLPTIIVLSPGNEILNKNNVFAWRDARNIPTIDFVQSMLSLVS